MVDMYKNIFGALRDSKQSIDPHFAYLIASVMAEIDGDIDDDEKQMLESLKEKVDEKLLKKIDILLKKSITYSDVSQYAKSLSNGVSSKHSSLLVSIAEKDKKRTPEEEAFLLQMASLENGNPRLNLHIFKDKKPAFFSKEKKIFKHDFFGYLDKNDIRKVYSDTINNFEDNEILIVDPLNSNNLVSLGEFDPKALLKTSLSKMITVFKDLGAREIIISDAKISKDEAIKQTKAGASAKVVGIGESSKSYESNFSSLEFSDEKEIIHVTFSGTDLELDDKKARELRKKISSRYLESMNLKEVIEGRIGSNKIQSYDHYVSFETLNQTYKSIAFAAKVGAVIEGFNVKASGNYSSETTEKHYEFADRYIYAFFH